MKPNEFIKVQAFNLETKNWEDITNGILSISTTTGSDTFQGFWDQPDSGQFVITSRGSTVDPNLNPLITTNTIIKVIVDDPTTFNDEAMFYGFITDVNVKYNKNEKQTVTINGTDLMGYLNRLVVTQDFIDTNITPNYPDAVVPADYLINYATYALAPELRNIFYIYYTAAIDLMGAWEEITPFFLELPPTAKIKVEVGKTLYELIALGMSSGLMRYETAYAANQFAFLPYYKNDPTFYGRIEEVLEYNRNFYARTDETDAWQVDLIQSPLGRFTFKGITLNNGLNKMINQVSVNNTNPANAEIITIDTVSSDTNLLNYGPAHLDAQTSYTTTTNPFWLSSSTIANQAEYFQNNILLDQAEPKTTIETITVDGTKWFNPTSGNRIPDNGEPIFVQHKLENGEYIKGFYKIAGIRHQITESDWTSEFILRSSEYPVIKSKRPKTPTFTITASTTPDSNGYYTTATNFTASINNYTSGDLANVDKIEWFVNFFQPGQFTNIPGNPPSQLNETLTYLNNPLPVFNGTSVTWSYDDNGVLEDYATATEFFSVFIGPGIYEAHVMITTKEGIKTWFDVGAFGIIAATAHADFSFTKNSAEQVTFIDISGADTNTWSWNFGDGTTYNGKTPPVKQYAAGGSYLVTLTVDNGYTTNSITKQVDISVYQIPVKYVRLRFQGSVTKAAGATDYSTDLIDTFGLLELKNENYTQTGGIQPFNIVVRQLDKVQDIGQTFRAVEGVTGVNHEMTYERIFNSDTPPEPGAYILSSDTHREWVFNYVNGKNYDPYYTTNYGSTSILNPMSQAYWDVWNEPKGAGTTGGTVCKYKFIPVITNNPDGSQTKSYDFDLIFDYSRTYNTGEYSASNIGSTWRGWYNKLAASSNSPTYIPGGKSQAPGSGSVLKNWTFWNTGSTADYNQKMKLKEINVWPGMDTKLNKAIEGGMYYLPGGNTVNVYKKPVDPPADRFGVQSGKTYLPITISVSDDGITYRKVAEANYVSGNTLTTTYVADMPPYSNAPLES